MQNYYHEYAQTCYVFSLLLFSLQTTWRRKWRRKRL